MLPLNPFLAAFFKSSVPAQCSPVHHHILLVPTTNVLLTSRETESTAPLAEYIATEEFLSSHVLRIPNTNVGGAPSPEAGGGGSKPGAPGGGKDAGRDGGAPFGRPAGGGSGSPGKDGAAPTQSLREVRGKGRIYSTINGRNVIIKDAAIFTNKGFKVFTNATILNDMTWYPDAIEPRQWLLYFISKPLLGNWEEIRIEPAVVIEGAGRRDSADLAGKAPNPDPGSSQAAPDKKDIRNFHEVLNHFPMIARHMQPGLERLFREFISVFEPPLPPPPSAPQIPDPTPDGPVTAAMKRVRSDSIMSNRSGGGASALSVAENYYADDDEDVMRASLESAVTAAIDLFQTVDKQQLSLLGATTDLTGPLVEKLIERYVTDNVHHILFPRVTSIKRPYDLELESKIRRMQYIDVSQLGIAIRGGARGKHELTLQLAQAVDEFKKMNTAMGPQEMMELLLSTIKLVTQLTQRASPEGEAAQSEKSVLTVNADTLVSLLLYVVIRAQVKHLQARLGYIRNFVFVDDVENGEIGYALSTFEAVLAYLSLDSAGLRRASRRNKALWVAVSNGDMETLRSIMEPDCAVVDDDEDTWSQSDGPGRRQSASSWGMANGSARPTALAVSEDFSLGSGLSHVFPFQADGSSDDLPQPPRRVKKVAMDTRSMSSGSEYSSHSRATSFGTIESALEGDVSIERLSQTCNAFGESVLMMAIQTGQREALEHLLSFSQYYPIEVILDDVNEEGTSLLSAAVQLGSTEVIGVILDVVLAQATQEQLAKYLAAQDIWGRGFGHYLFHAPSLIPRIGLSVPWRQRDKNGQTPLFALCRSYDHGDYLDMVTAGLAAATEAQRDGRPLHLDDHVDAKGNTLLHIVNDPRLALMILHQCDVDVNATNEKRFTALMLASKYGRYEMVRSLFSDSRVDTSARELRGLTAVELAKDDEVRDKIDDLALSATHAGSDGRITGVVRAFFVEDATIRLVLKSAAPSDANGQTYVVTTSRRSLTDFEHLSNLLALENPASWIPAVAGLRTPFQIPSKPSRAVLRDIQSRADWFLKIMMEHPTFATHEMLWEFILVPDLQLGMMEQRSRLKAETRAEKVCEELEPVADVREVEQFVDHAQDMVRGVNYATKSVTRRLNAVVMATIDLHEASALFSRALCTLRFLPQTHLAAFDIYLRTLAPATSSPHSVLHSHMAASQNMIQALITALSKPAAQAVHIVAARRAADRTKSSLGRSAASRWPLGILDDTRQRLLEEKEDKARRAREEVDSLGRELRYSQQVVAGELAGWQDMHERLGKRALRDFARGMVVLERGRLEGVERALRRLGEGRTTGGRRQAAGGR